MFDVRGWAWHAAFLKVARAAPTWRVVGGEIDEYRDCLVSFVEGGVMLKKDRTHCWAQLPGNFARVSNDGVAVPREV